MGGDSSQTTMQQSTTNPWAPAQPLLNGILGSLSGSLGNTGLNSTQQNAINTLTANGNSANQFTPAINNSTASLLAGGGALAQAPMVQAAYNQYGANTSPLANNTNYDPMATPGIGDQLQALKDSITQNVNGSFAAAGRSGSGYNQKALASGLASGLAPVLTNQYNQNVNNQQTAAGNLYNAGNTNAGILSGLQQQYLSNQAAGVNQVGTGLNSANAGANSALNAQTMGQQLPLQNLGLLANIGIPIAGLGGQSTGQSNTNASMSGAQQFNLISGGLGNLAKLLF